ncbi:MAG: choice-of-anchor D domain-containing protein, partial [Pseudomonadota bacterium]
TTYHYRVVGQNAGGTSNGADMTFTTVGEPEIRVSGNGQDITNGDVSPDPGDHTEFDFIVSGQSSSTRTFTIHNDGSTDLVLGASGVSISGLNASHFTVVSQPNETIAPSGSASVQVQFNIPSGGSGISQANVSITSNDPDAGQYRFAISGRSFLAPTLSKSFADGSIAVGETTTMQYLIRATEGDWAFSTFSDSLPAGYQVVSPANVSLTGCGTPTISASGSSVTLAGGAIGVTTSGFGSGTCRISVDVVGVQPGTHANTISNLTGNLAIAPRPAVTVSGASATLEVTAAAPEVTTEAATDITTTTVTLNGTVDANQSETTTSFEYGTDVNYGESINAVPEFVSGDGPTNVSVQLTGLLPNTTYHYRVVGRNNAGLALGEDRTFMTSGTAEIRVTGGSNQEIVDGDTTAGFSDTTRFGRVIAGQTDQTKTFTIHNDGAVALNIDAGAVQLEGADPDAFEITARPSATVAPGDSTSLTIRYQTTEGTAEFARATVSIPNDDSDEDPYRFAILAESVLPPSFAKSFSTSSIAVGETARMAYTITEVQGGLAHDSMGFTDALPAGYSVASPANLNASPACGRQTVSAAGGSVSVSGLAVSSGRTCTIEVDVIGVSPGLHENTTSDLNGRHLGDPDNPVFTVAAARASLEVTAPEIVVTTGTASGIGTTGAQLNGSILPNGSETALSFEIGLDTTYGTTVEADPSSVTGGDELAVNAVVADLTPNTTYHFRIVAMNQGQTFFGEDQTFTTLGLPEIDIVSSVSGALQDGGTDAQGEVSVGVVREVTYTVTNTGTAPLALGDVTSGAVENVQAESITQTGASVLASGETTEITVSYVADEPGDFSFMLSIENSDLDENAFDIEVSGRVTGAPEIEVISSVSGPLEDGGSDPQGEVPLGETHTITYEIANLGAADLSLGSAVASSVENATIESIEFSEQSVLAPDERTELTISYVVEAPGDFSFLLSIENSDSDENPFDVAVSGTGEGAPEIDIVSSVSGAVDDGGTDAQGEVSAGVLQDVTYTVTNTGTGPLTLGEVTSGGLENVLVESITQPGAAVLASG